VWFFLRFIPLEPGPVLERTLYSKVIEVQAVNFLGLGGTPARLLGAAGGFIGSLLGLDGVVSWVWKLLTRKKPSSV
jgi:hypothetical protein